MNEAKKLSRRAALTSLGAAAAMLPTLAAADSAPRKGRANQKVMLLLTYTPRDDINLDDYHDWLRSTDNPFFNSRPSVKHYANWRVLEAKLGARTFTHFDLLEVRALDGYDEVFADPKIVAFAKEWVRKWGKVPDPGLKDESVNYQIYLCEQVAAPRHDS